MKIAYVPISRQIFTLFRKFFFGSKNLLGSLFWSKTKNENPKFFSLKVHGNFNKRKQVITKRSWNFSFSIFYVLASTNGPKINLPHAAHDHKRLLQCNCNTRGYKRHIKCFFVFPFNPKVTNKGHGSRQQLNYMWSEMEVSWTEEPGSFPALELFQKAVSYQN